jgi:flagellar biogenesis protein FliO
MEAVRQFIGVALTLALLAGLLLWLRRRGVAQWRGARGGRALEIIESRALGPGHTLHLVRVADRVMALATHGGGCTLLEARAWSELRPIVSPEAGA